MSSSTPVKLLDCYLAFAKRSLDRWQAAMMAIEREQYTPQRLIKDTVAFYSVVLSSTLCVSVGSREGTPVLSYQTRSGHGDVPDQAITVPELVNTNTVRPTDLAHLDGKGAIERTRVTLDFDGIKLRVGFKKLFQNDDDSPRDLRPGDYLGTVHTPNKTLAVLHVHVQLVQP